MIKKRTIIVFLLLALQSSLFAMYMGNPASLVVIDRGFYIANDYWLGVKLHYQGDVLLDKSLKPTSSNIKKVEKMKYTMQLGGVSLNFVDRAELYGSLGAQKFHFDIRTNATTMQEIETSNDLAWQLGLKVLLYEQGPITLGFDLVYETAHPRISTIVQNGTPFRSAQGAKFRYQEWQFGLGVSYSTNFITPYIAYAYSHPTIKFSNFSPGYLPHNKKRFNVKGEKKSGGIIGASITSGEYFSITLEARFIDETAFTAAGNLKF